MSMGFILQLKFFLALPAERLRSLDPHPNHTALCPPLCYRVGDFSTGFVFITGLFLLQEPFRKWKHFLNSSFNKFLVVPSRYLEDQKRADYRLTVYVLVWWTFLSN